MHPLHLFNYLSISHFMWNHLWPYIYRNNLMTLTKCWKWFYDTPLCWLTTLYDFIDSICFRTLHNLIQYYINVFLLYLHMEYLHFKLWELGDYKTLHTTESYFFPYLGHKIHGNEIKILYKKTTEVIISSSY